MIQSILDKVKNDMPAGREAEVQTRYIAELEARVRRADLECLADSLVQLAPEKRIQCIKIFRMVTKLGLGDAKDHCDAAYARHTGRLPGLLSW